MAIKFGGINTGLPPNLVDQLIQAERIPIQNQEIRKAKTENRLKLVNEMEGYLQSIRGSLNELAGSKGFTNLAVQSGDPNIISGVAEAGSGAKGSWNIEVLQMAGKSAAISNGFPDKNETEIGVGYFSFDTAEGEKDVYISGSTSTLEGAAAAINAASLGVRASVIQDASDKDNPFRLLVSGIGLGEGEQIEYPTLYLLDGDQDMYWDKDLPSQNARVKVDGFEIELPENRIEGLADGLTLDIRQAAPGKVVNVTVKEDQEAVLGKVESFVESVNNVLSFIQKQNALTSESDTSATLGGDGMLRTVETDLRRIIQNPVLGVNSNIQRVSQLGITFNRNGTLDFDKDKFNKVLLSQPDEARKFLAGDGFATGFIPTIKRKVGTYFDGAFGLISNRKRNLNQKIRQADDRIENIERRVANKEKTLRRQFANLEEKMSKIKSQGSFLQQRLGGAGAGGLNLGGASQGES